MSSSKNSGFRYVRDRCVNAYWMIRAGKFKLIFKSIYVELAHRSETIRNMLSRPKPVPDSQIPYSDFVDLRKTLPPSYRPTTAQPPLPVSLRADPMVIGGDLKQILATISVEEGVDR